MNDWLTATAILLSGLVVGFMFIYSMKRSAASGEAERRDLEAKLDARVRQLRELEDEGRNDPDERARLEREAADALRALEHASSAAPPPADAALPPTTTKQRHPSGKNDAMKGFAWGAGSVAALAALVFFVTSSAKQRGANEGITGGPEAGPSSAMQPAQQLQPPQNDPQIQQLEARVKASPDDLNLRNELAKAQLDRENFLGAIEQTRYVLERAPNDPHALTYEALVRIAMGQADGAVPMLERAVKSDPSLLEAQVALAWVYTNMGRTADAERAMNEARTRHPEERAKLDEVFARMKAGPQQEAAAPQQPPAGAPSGPSVHVTVSAPDNVRIARTAFVFVYARAAGVTSGPPAAVKRLPAAGFPLQVELSAADSMMGQPLPESMRLEARIDSDGNPMTKEPGDLTASAENVRAGSSVTLALR